MYVIESEPDRQGGSKFAARQQIKPFRQTLSVRRAQITPIRQEALEPFKSGGLQHSFKSGPPIFHKTLQNPFAAQTK